MNGELWQPEEVGQQPLLHDDSITYTQAIYRHVMVVQIWETFWIDLCRLNRSSRETIPDTRVLPPTLGRLKNHHGIVP